MSAVKGFWRKRTLSCNEIDRDSKFVLMRKHADFQMVVYGWKQIELYERKRANEILVIRRFQAERRIDSICERPKV